MVASLLLSFLSASAYDFESGGIYYNVISETDKTCEVTYKSTAYDSYSGKIIIPPTIAEGPYAGYSVISIGDSAFRSCFDLTSVEIPNSVNSIGNYAFYDCTGLNSVKIGTGVLSIGKEAFCRDDNYSNLPLLNLCKIILLPNTVPSGLSDAFGGSISNRITYVANDNYSGKFLGTIKKYDFLSSMFEADGVIYVPISLSERTCAAIDCTYDPEDKDISIGKTVNYNGVGMTLTEINPNVLRNNAYVESIDVSTPIDIPVYFAENCKSLQNITLNNTGYIGESAFYDAISLQTLTIGSTVTDIKDYAFYGAMSNGKNGQITLNNTGYIGKSAFFNASALQTLTIGNEVKDINNYAFYGCTKLETIQLPETISSIGASAFRNCSSLKDINIPSQITSISTSSFYGCSALQNIELPNGLKTIGSYAFYESGLVSITIPAATTEINFLAFSDSSLEKFTAIDGMSDLNLAPNVFQNCPLQEVYLGRNLVYDTNNTNFAPFYCKTTLQKVTLTDIPTEVFTNEFYGCTALKEVSIGDGVKKIGDYAFSGCSAIETFSFGASVTEIGAEAFSDCTAMTKLFAEPTVPPICGTQALDDINKWNCTLYVNNSSINDYKAADQWKEFFFMEPHDFESGIVDIKGNPDFDGIYRIYTTNGVLLKTTVNIEDVNSLPSGIYIVNGKKLLKK